MKQFSKVRAKARGKRRAPANRRARSRRVKVTPEIRAYVRKIDAYRAGRNPIPLMRSAPAKLARAVAGLTAAQMRRRPARGKWCIVEILGHLHDTEYVYGYRWRLCLSEPRAPIAGYDQAGWTVAMRHRRASAKRLIAQIRAMREGNLDTVLRMRRSEWKRYGVHSERGNESVRRGLELIAGHDLNHLDQIRTIRKKFRW